MANESATGHNTVDALCYNCDRCDRLLDIIIELEENEEYIETLSNELEEVFV